MDKTWVDFPILKQETLLFIFFVMSNVLCILVFGVILRLSMSTKNYETKNRYFNALCAFQIMYFLVDIIWALGYFQIISIENGGLTLVRYSKMIYFIVASYAAFCWFMYIEIQMGAKFSSSKKNRLLIGIPILISNILTIIISIVTNEQKIVKNPLVSISMMYIPFFYMVFASIFCVIMAVKASSKIKKRRYFDLAIIPIGLMIGTVLQVYLLEIPVFCLSSTYLIFLVYISKTQSQVSTDALTGINNRSALTKYIGEYTKFDCTYVLMIDVDKFKLINDNFGHVEGDRALVLLAEALKIGTERIKEKCFLARYGGDEFIIIVSSENEFEIENLVNILHEEVANTHKKTKNYQLQVSIGYSRIHENESILSVIENADENMYKIKVEKKRK